MGILLLAQTLLYALKLKTSLNIQEIYCGLFKKLIKSQEIIINTINFF